MPGRPRPRKNHCCFLRCKRYLPGGNRSAVGDGTRQSVDLFPAFGKKDEYLAIISLGSSLGDGFVRKVATSGNDQYAVMDAGEWGGNAKEAVSAAPGRSGNFVQFIMVFCFLDTGWPHPATQSSRRNSQPVICCLLCIAYSFIARNVEAGMPASFTRFALVKGCQP